MVKVTFKSWEEVVIHESIQHSLEELIKLNSIGVQPGGLAPPLQWAEGVVFRFLTIAQTDEVIREALQGRVHWTGVAWALMPEYKNVILIPETNVKIPVINGNTSAILCEVAKALKAQQK